MQYAHLRSISPAARVTRYSQSCVEARVIARLIVSRWETLTRARTDGQLPGLSGDNRI